MTAKDQSHERAREQVEFYLRASNYAAIFHNKPIMFHQDFVKKHKLEKRYQGHSFDIRTPNYIIEIDDYGKHSKKNQKINDGIINEYVKEYLTRFNFFRLQKEEIVDSKGYLQPTAAEYLRKALF